MIFMGGGRYFGPEIFFFPHRSLAFLFFLRDTVLDFFSQDHVYKKVCHVSVDSYLEMDTRLIKSSFVKVCKMGYKN